VIDINGLSHVGSAAAGVMLVAIAMAFILKFATAPKVGTVAAPVCE
jgi:anti-anti-sigma regulatory factor